LRAFGVIAGVLVVAWVGWVVLEMPGTIARERAMERRRRRSMGLCERCAYDPDGKRERGLSRVRRGLGRRDAGVSHAVPIEIDRPPAPSDPR
jgi:hypothetical protein